MIRARAANKRFLTTTNASLTQWSISLLCFKDSFIVSQNEFQTASTVNFCFFSFTLVVWKVNFLEGVFIYFHQNHSSFWMGIIRQQYFVLEISNQYGPETFRLVRPFVFCCGRVSAWRCTRCWWDPWRVPQHTELRSPSNRFSHLKIVMISIIFLFPFRQNYVFLYYVKPVFFLEINSSCF